MSLIEPIDPTHRESLEALGEIRLAFATARAGVASWEPAPYPGKPYVDRVPHLEELDRPRPWFR